MPITTSNGTTYSDDQIKSFFAANPDASSVAKQASSLGLNEGQIKQASDIAGKNWSDADINGYAQNNGYNWAGSGGGLMANNQPGTTGATTGSNTAATGAPGGMTIGSTYYTPDQIKQFYAGGGDDRQFVQQHGITDLDQQRQLQLQARQIAGNYATGDAGLQQAFKSYQATNPNGAFVNNYEGWLNDTKGDPAKYNALISGQYTGASTSSADFGPGGIYGPGTGHDFGYAQSGQGALGIGDGWGTAGTSGTGGTGVLGGTGGGIIAGGTGGGVGAGTGNGGTTATGGTTGATPWNVTAPQTVAGQINTLLDPNNSNGIIQQARTGALANMNGRGLLNSSLAQTASDSAAYNAALPIAQADAGTNANAAQFNATGQNTFNLNTQNQANTMAQLGFSAQTQKDLAQANALYSNLANQTATASSIQNWGNNTITAIQTSDLSADAKNAAISAVTQYLQNSYSIQGDWHNSAAQAIANIFGKAPATGTTSAPNNQQSLTNQVNPNAGQPGYF